MNKERLKLCNDFKNAETIYEINLRVSREKYIEKEFKTTMRIFFGIVLIITFFILWITK